MAAQVPLYPPHYLPSRFLHLSLRQLAGLRPRIGLAARDKARDISLKADKLAHRELPVTTGSS